jgi:PAS domain S-box-containing protein
MPRQLAHKLAERFAELRDREQTVAAELSAYKALLDLAPCPMVLFTREGAVVYANQAYCNMLSTTLEEIAVNGWLNKVVPEDRERIWTVWQQFISKQAERTLGTVTFAAKNGPLTLTWQAVLLEQNGYAAVLYHPGCVAGEMARKLAAEHGC